MAKPIGAVAVDVEQLFERASGSVFIQPLCDGQVTVIGVMDSEGDSPDLRHQAPWRWRCFSAAGSRLSLEGQPTGQKKTRQDQNLQRVCGFHGVWGRVVQWV